MKNILNRKGWRTGAFIIYVDLPPITRIKINNDTKSEKESVKIKLH